MKYILTYKQPTQHFIDIEFIIDSISKNELIVQLPAWRPGRYELGNFAKNIQQWNIFDEKGKELKYEKLTKDSWKVFCKGAKKVSVKYNYYAAELNAGSSYMDENQLYVNPVNCLLYVNELIGNPCEIKLEIPKNYIVATGLTELKKNNFKAKSFHELADSPIIASSSIKHHTFIVQKVKFHLWLNGESKPNFKQLETDFKKFCNRQINAFGEFPTKEFHFLIHVLPYKAYHGVEHYNSTVITIGPSYDVFNNKDWYNELLGVSSHELYHTWNVKQIRPTDMLPYDYSKENYSTLGYIYEGITTYMGDKMLLVSETFDWKQYTKTFDELLLKHYHNPGIFNQSVAQSSFDTWLDGYSKGIPNRKTSIYTEGALIAFITDIFILKNSNNKKSLNDVMKKLYIEFAKKNKGITNEDYRNVVEQLAGKSFDNLYNSLIIGNKDFTPFLKQSLDYIGCKLNIAPSKNYNESHLGFKVRYENGRCLVDWIYPNSIAEINGLAVNDEIIAINKYRIINDFEHWSNYFNSDVQYLSIKRELGKLDELKLKGGKNTYFNQYSIDTNDIKQKNFLKWKAN